MVIRTMSERLKLAKCRPFPMSHEKSLMTDAVEKGLVKVVGV